MVPGFPLTCVRPTSFPTLPRKHQTGSHLRFISNSLPLRHQTPGWILSPCALSGVGRCCECGCILSQWYYEREAKLYCKRHYWARYGEHCHGCKEAITTGLIMVRDPLPDLPIPILSSSLYHARHHATSQKLTLIRPFSPIVWPKTAGNW